MKRASLYTILHSGEIGEHGYWVIVVGTELIVLFSKTKKIQFKARLLWDSLNILIGLSTTRQEISKFVNHMQWYEYRFAARIELE